MNREFLVTVSRDQSAQYGVRFISQFFSNKDTLDIALFYTTSQQVADQRMLSSNELAEQDRECKKQEQLGREALEKARSHLILNGFNPKQIRTSLHFRRASTAIEIVQEGERGLYDAIVLGSRGLSWLETLLEDSVSHEILDKRLTIPLWICRKPEPERRNVLACVDDSEQAFRMVDHVGFILAHETSQEITLLNIYDPHSGDRIFADAIFDRCEQILADNNIDPTRVHRKMLESYNISKGILDMATRHRFAVVAAGRTGEDKGFMKRIFMGSVSSELYKELTGAALWLSR